MFHKMDVSYKIPEGFELIKCVDYPYMIIRCTRCGLIQKRNRKSFLRTGGCIGRGCELNHKHGPNPYIKPEEDEDKKTCVHIKEEYKNRLPAIPEKLHLKGCINLAGTLLRSKDWEHEAQRDFSDLCGIDYDYLKMTRNKE